MTTRRQFLRGAAAGSHFAVAPCSTPRAPSKAALPVMVAGKRVRTIDVHCHCLFHEALILMGDDAKSLVGPNLGAQLVFIGTDERLKAVDAMAVDMEVLSINPSGTRKIATQQAK